MPTWAWIVIIVAAVLVISAVAFAALRGRRSRRLQQGFGPEYDRTVERAGGRRAGERELTHRQKRHEALDIRPLPPQARERYVHGWEVTQTRFVDDPSGAVAEADALVRQVMKERGYPTDDFEQRAADISVEHPQLVERYRTAHGIAQSSERGQASTEDLRQSVRHYRALFEELLGERSVDAPISRDATRDREEAAEEVETETRS
jgi:hypothetical protein